MLKKKQAQMIGVLDVLKKIIEFFHLNPTVPSCLDPSIISIFSVFFAFCLLIIVAVVTRFFRVNRNFEILIPTILCGTVIIFGIIAILLPNGIGGLTQLECFIFIVYPFKTFVYAGLVILLIKVLRHFIK